MDPADPTRLAVTEQLLEKLYAAGAIPTRGSLALCDKLSTSSFCRRRLAVVLVRLKMAETLREATTFVEQGHVRVGPDVVTSPSFLVTRAAEDFVTWADSSQVKRTIQRYNDALDDFELLNA
jgi:U3 small nucleolar ribonucleoprotein protein IMP3